MLLMLIAAIIQMRVGRTLDENLEEASLLVSEAASAGAELICLPEYFFAESFKGKTPADVHEETYERTVGFLRKLSAKYGVVLAGTVLEKEEKIDAKAKYFNTCLVYDGGELLLKQRKVHLTEGEERWGLSCGDSFSVASCRGFKIGVLVCADVLYPEAGRLLGLLGADIVINPVISRFYENDPTKDARQCIFVARAYDNSFFILKTGGVGVSPFGNKIVGRSLAAAPWGLLAKPKDENEPEVIIVQLDIDLLRRLRDENYSLVRRNKKAYEPLLS
ncbi:MAG TPA: carbon-nitrogen hydrolase family protein [Methanomicrobia archaeon]|nr:carbon-nitrogen hydrolase family protein [Methanomicrobia archaeon]HEX59450.1 carbon-nitrogen hydrolase family protein [Methanomicrobia archaeon]